MIASTFLALRNYIWHIAALTRCGGHVGNSPPVVGCSACGLVLRGLKNEMVQSTSAARFLLRQSVAATERTRPAQPSIRQPPRLGRPVVAQFRKKSRPPVTLLKGYSCCVHRQRRNTENNHDHVICLSHESKDITFQVYTVGSKVDLKNHHARRLNASLWRITV